MGVKGEGGMGWGGPSDGPGGESRRSTGQPVSDCSLVLREFWLGEQGDLGGSSLSEECPVWQEWPAFSAALGQWLGIASGK